MATLRSSKLNPNQHLPSLYADVDNNRESKEFSSLVSSDQKAVIESGHLTSLDHGQRDCRALHAPNGQGIPAAIESSNDVNALPMFSQQSQRSTEASNSITHSSPAESSTGTPLLTESSTMSLQEMFEQDELLPLPSDFAHGESHPQRHEGTQPEDQWFSGDGEFLEKDEHASYTPPLSLYSSHKDGYCSNVPSTIPESSNPSSVCSSGMNTPVSCVSQSTAMVSSGEGAMGSMGSSTTASVSRYRPLLYSAIGSLENSSAASLGDLNKRVGPRRDFSKIGSAQPLLIPPLTTIQSAAKTDLVRSLLAVDRQEVLTASTRATPMASNRKQNTENETQTNLDASDQRTVPPKEPKASSLKQPATSKSKSNAKNGKGKRVSIKKDSVQKQPLEMFRPSCDAYTPRIEKKRIEYRKAEMRTPVQKMASPMGTLSRPNFRDALRRVAMIIHQHIVKIERRFEGIDSERSDQGLFTKSMRETFSEENYCTPTYKCTMVRIPMARPGMVYGLRRIKTKPAIPSEEEIYEFAHQLFKAVQLSSECSIVCLIYVERLMEVAKVPLLANTWRPIFMCGLLLASKVWQDLSSWNIEFASVYPQYSLDAINRLELNFLRNVKWDLYISSSLYAKYYFALRSLVEKVDFRQRYNRMVGGVDNVAQSEAMKIAKRTEQFKEETILQLSRSM